MKNNLFDLALAADRHFCRRPVPEAARARTWARLQGGLRRPKLRAWVRAVPLFVAASLTTAAALFLADAERSPPARPSMTTLSIPVLDAATSAAQTSPSRLSVAPSCAVEPDPGSLVLEGPCAVRLRDPSLAMTSLGTSRIRWSEDELAVEEGWVVFDVDPVADGPPVRIEVLAGTIEVLGTRFAVYQDARRGHIQLVEGKIRMIEHTGTEAVMEAGERHAWTNVGVDPRSVSVQRSRAIAPRNHRLTPSHRGADVLGPGAGGVEEIARLRRRGHYQQALRLARRLATRATDNRATEVLDYEAGTIIDDALEDVDQACRHWKSHARRFQNGRYQDEVRRRQRALGCSATGN